MRANPPESLRQLLALSLRQPWAELVLQGRKKIEYRTLPTNLRGRVAIYAGQGRYAEDEESEWARQYKLDIDALPRGVLVGSVEVTSCRENDDGYFEWKLANPVRIARPVKPWNHPQPRFFYPFEQPARAERRAPITTATSRITANDIRTRILPLPSAVFDAIPEDVESIAVRVGRNSEPHDCGINRDRKYVAGVTALFRAHGLIADDGTARPCEVAWQFDARRSAASLRFRGPPVEAAVHRVNYWVVRGHTASSEWTNDWSDMLKPGRRGTWTTRKPPKRWQRGDRLFFFALAPTSSMVGLGVLERTKPGDAGFTDFIVKYLTAPFAKPVEKRVFERNRRCADAHFLKSGPTNTVLSLTEAQAAAMYAEIVAVNPRLRPIWEDILPMATT